MQIMQKVWWCRSTFSVITLCTPCATAHFENVKVSEMPRCNLEIWLRSECSIPWKSWPFPLCKSARNAMGATRKNRMKAARKNWSARYLLSTSKGSFPMVGYNHKNCCNHYSRCDDCNGYSHSDDNSHYDDCRRWGKAECKDMFWDFFFVEKSSPKPHSCKGRSFVFLVAVRGSLRVERVYV